MTTFHVRTFTDYVDVDEIYKERSFTLELDTTWVLKSTFDLRYSTHMHLVIPRGFRNGAGISHTIPYPGHKWDDNIDVNLDELRGIDGDETDDNLLSVFYDGNLGDAGRTLIVRVPGSGVVGDYLANLGGNVWSDVDPGYTDPFTDYSTFKTEVCTQIENWLQNVSGHPVQPDYNVLIFFAIETDNVVYANYNVMVLYYTGNDPNADETIVI